ncbi:hypothetical protein PoB_000033200 [Plakobranchus ocellatus]|uniref:Uncharacterized protein n=1 Tax=Plakobranchus ocellatus TaxID=259542 RepID=A0AAV3XUJ7_9GAST|nr:hypothetical protein PoB_000033200 [Plakobranchus ocellatus]
MNINFDSKCMHDSVGGHNINNLRICNIRPQCNIPCKGDRIEQVNTFKHLGCTDISDGKYDTEIEKRIEQYKTTFNNRKCKDPCQVSWTKRQKQMQK